MAYSEFSEALAAKMASVRYSDRVLAAELGLDKSAVCRARIGKEVKVETFLTLCRWLKFDPLSRRSLPVTGAGEPTHRHKKRGTEYRVVSREARLQVEPGTILKDDDRMVIYQDVHDGSWGVRLPAEFDDGRFEPLCASPSSPVDEAPQKALDAGRDLIDAWCERYANGMPPVTARDKLVTDILALASPEAQGVVTDDAWHDRGYAAGFKAGVECGMNGKPDEINRRLSENAASNTEARRALSGQKP